MGLTGLFITHNCAFSHKLISVSKLAPFVRAICAGNLLRFCIYFREEKCFHPVKFTVQIGGINPLYRLQTLVSGSNPGHEQKIRTDTVTTRKLDKKHIESRTCSLFCFFTPFWWRSIYVSRWFRAKPSTYLQFFHISNIIKNNLIIWNFVECTILHRSIIF